MILEILVYSPLNHLTQLLVQKIFLLNLVAVRALYDIWHKFTQSTACLLKATWTRPNTSSGNTSHPHTNLPKGSKRYLRWAGRLLKHTHLTFCTASSFWHPKADHSVLTDKQIKVASPSGRDSRNITAKGDVKYCEQTNTEIWYGNEKARNIGK